MQRLKEMLAKAKGKVLGAAAVVGSVAGMGVSAFASTSPDIGITTSMIEPIVDYVVENIKVIMPVGITVMGIMIGIGLIPKIIHKFTSS